MASDYDRIQLAHVAERWKKTKGERERASKARQSHRFDRIDTPERIVKYARRLQEQVRSVEAGQTATARPIPASVKEFAESGPVGSGQVTSAFVERIIGETKNFLSSMFFELGLRAMSTVARIDIQGPGGSGTATGFMVSPSLMLTNWHVFETAEWAHGSRAQFDYQRDRTGKLMQVQEFAFDSDLFVSDERLDFALVAVKPANLTSTRELATFGFCPLVGLEGKILVTDPVNIVQHPMGRLKEVVIRENELSALPGGDLDGFAHYVTDTEQGSSGSPVFSDRWEVIALHHSGVPAQNEAGQYLARDGTVWDQSMSIDNLRWIGNEGIRTSRIVARLTEMRPAMSAGMGALVDQLLGKSTTVELGPNVEAAKAATAAAPPPPGGGGGPPGDAAQSGGSGGTIVNLPTGAVSTPGPVIININIGTAPAAPAAAAVVAFPEAARPKDFRIFARPGFDARFLGFDAPLPALKHERHGKLATLDDGTSELRYFHFSVLMNADRRLAYVSAVNYDHAAPFKPSRSDPGWFVDPRLDRRLQAENRHYSDFSGQENPLDRGHLTRRADASWGRTEEQAVDAGIDSYHWCNVAPQHKVFNQSKLSQPNDLRLWGELEDHVTSQAGAGFPQLSIFNGPVFSDADRDYRGLRIPTAFWKLIAYRRRDGSPGALGFVIEQTDLVDRLTEAAVGHLDPGPFEVRQVKIAAIEDLTGLDFAPLAPLDPMARGGLFESSATNRRLTSLGDIRL